MQKYIFQLFIMTGSAESSNAVKNVNAFCENHLKGRCQIEIIDLKEKPSWAAKENIFALPLLIKKFPLPEERMIGDLSDFKKMLAVLKINY